MPRSSRKPDRDAPPTVLPAETQDKPRIRIEAGPEDRNRVQAPVADRFQYYLNYYRTYDEDPSLLKEKVTLLNQNKKPREVQAMLVGYLTYHAKDAEPWMYEALALALKINQGDSKDVKTALGYAANLAERARNPNYLVSVADLLFLLGYYERVGRLLDEAAVLVPHRAEPLMMSINLAQKTRDAQRMGDSIERLLSLGWPGHDERIRRDARQQAEVLARSLREEAKSSEAEALLARLPEIEARDLFLRLSWVGDADLDLAVEEPLGATARYRTPRTVYGGSIVKNGYGSHPDEVYVCPRAFDGEYKIRVETIYNNPKNPALAANLEIITHEGTPEEHKETRTITLSHASTPVVVTLKGGRRKEVLPYLAPTAELPAPEAKKRSPGEKKRPSGARKRSTAPASPAPRQGPAAASPTGPPSTGAGAVRALPQ